MKHYAYSLCFDVFCCGLILADFTHIIQGYFNGTGAIMDCPSASGSNPEEYGGIQHMNPTRMIRETKLTKALNIIVT